MQSVLNESLLGYPIFCDNVNSIQTNSKIVINTINQYSYCLAEENLNFKCALQNSDVLLPDGVGIVSAVRLLTGKKIKKIAGADIHHYLLEKLNNIKGKCFYLGSSENTLTKIQKQVFYEYPNIQVEYYSPPFKSYFLQEENDRMISMVNAFKPDVLFIGMTAPKQEIWAFLNRNRIDAKIICSIGAVFDFYSGVHKRPGQIWIDLGLEWFVRFVKEPKRMWKRYFYYGPIFFKIVITNYIKLKLFP